MYVTKKSKRQNSVDTANLLLYDYINKFPQLVKSITATDIIRVANKYFEQPYVFTIVAPQNCLKNIK